MSADDRNDFPLSPRPSFEQIVRQHRRGLLSHVRLVYPSADAETVVNDTFSIAWQRIGDEPIESAGAWLRSIARFVVLNSNRGQRRWQALNERVAQLDVPPPVDPPDADARLQLAVVVEALEKLGQKDREMLLMVALDDLSSEDLAIIFDISPEAAKVRISRARKRLRAAVASAELAGSRRQESTSIEERRGSA